MNIPHSKTTLSSIDHDAILQSLQNGNLTSGWGVSEFTRRFAEYVGVNYARAFSCGSVAIYTILRSLKLKSNEEVLIPDYICPDVYKSLINADVKPVIYDNEQNSWVSSAQQIGAKVTKKTRVILVNHTFGIKFPDIKDLKLAFPEIVIIEDCCHRIQPKSSQLTSALDGDFAVYSFNATKLLAAGEGGLVACENQEYFEALEKATVDKGFSDLLAALALTQLSRFDDFLAQRKQLAYNYFNNLPDYVLQNTPRDNNIFFRFPIITERAVELLKHPVINFRKGVDTLVSDIMEQDSSVNAKKMYDKTVSLPIYPSLTESDQDYIINELLNEL